MLEILLIEDDRATADLVRRLLVEIDADVQDTAKLSEALHICEVLKFDLLVLDLRLLDASIDTTINSIPMFRKRQPEAKLLVLSGYPDPDIKQRCLDAGANLFICKRDAIDKGAQALFVAFNTLIAGLPNRNGDERFLASAKMLEKLATA